MIYMDDTRVEALKTPVQNTCNTIDLSGLSCASHLAIGFLCEINHQVGCR